MKSHNQSTSRNVQLDLFEDDVFETSLIPRFELLNKHKYQNYVAQKITPYGVVNDEIVVAIERGMGLYRGDLVEGVDGNSYVIQSAKECLTTFLESRHITPLVARRTNHTNFDYINLLMSDCIEELNDYFYDECHSQMRAHRRAR
ncbi:hypothetical protein JK159_02480 [Weissella minor]|uniref:hypothetical protein n=1 Tax=Weissella minor TaxID=1620 RepID=UPI001BAFC3D0|nr:hypothetical protein [Weissella minor]MBS0949250.1 hypothetical protein [Weissella minor]